MRKIIMIILSVLLVITTILSTCLLTIFLVGFKNVDQVRQSIAINYILENLDEVFDMFSDNICDDVTDFNNSEDTPQTNVDTENNMNVEEETVIKDSPVEGVVLFEKQGIKVTAFELNMNGFYGPELTVIVENNSTTDITIGIDNVAVNGYMIDPIFSETVTTGNRCKTTIDWFEDDFEACEITQVKTIEGEFLVYDSLHAKYMFQTNRIRINF